MDSIAPEFSTPHAILKLYIHSENPEFIELYKAHVLAHNEQIHTAQFPNSGFDIFVPTQELFDNHQMKLIDLQIITEMYTVNSPTNTANTAFYVYPRSSMSKTPLILSNHVGIIDQGYRGTLKAAFRTLSKNEYILDKYTRLLQICHPALLPIHVILVTDKNELSSTERGTGGFGSTGIIGTLRAL